MGHQSVAEEGGYAAARAVEELVGDDEIERPVLLFERATALSEMMRSTPSDFMP